MIYNFHQNNSGGFFTQPAKNIIVKDARDSEHALEIAMAAGLYLDGVRGGADCECCGDRWDGGSYDFDTLDEAIESASDISWNDEIPPYIVVDDLDVADTVLE